MTMPPDCCNGSQQAKTAPQRNPLYAAIRDMLEAADRSRAATERVVEIARGDARILVDDRLVTIEDGHVQVETLTVLQPFNQ